MTVFPPPYQLQRPTVPQSPFVFASPHSGHYYPPDFLALTTLPFQDLRALEDFAVDRLFAWAPQIGAYFLTANYARAYVDLNRHPYAVDPDIFAQPLPISLQTNLIKQRHGLGTIPAIALNGQKLYQNALPLSVLHERLERVHTPYHKTLQHLITTTQQRFGACYLFDCHSMPSCAGRYHRDRQLDIVLGDNHGCTFDDGLLVIIKHCLQNYGYHVALNTPYAGAYTTQTYAQPKHGIFTLQIEINRLLYMCEGSLTWQPEKAETLRGHLRHALQEALIHWQNRTSLMAAE